MGLASKLAARTGESVPVRNGGGAVHRRRVSRSGASAFETGFKSGSPAVANQGGPAIHAAIISSMVSLSDQQSEVSRAGSDWVHVSSLLDFCPRRTALLQAEGGGPPQLPSSSDRVMWAIGRAVERHAREAFIQAVGFAGVFGRWHCPCGHETRFGFHDPEPSCPRCLGRLNAYAEITLFDNERRITGNPDMIWVSNGKALVVEIKSMTKTSFNPMEAPKGDHTFQATAYHLLLSRALERGEIPGANFTMHPEVAIFYCRKEYEFKTPYKEFHHEAVGSYSVVNAAFGEVERLRAAQAPGRLPSRLSCCNDLSDPVPKKCPVACSCLLRP